MSHKIGRSTIQMSRYPSFTQAAAVVGKKEGEGPLAREFDVICDDTTLGEETWEKSESRMQKDAVNKVLEKAGLSSSDIDVLFAGDLLNQCISSTYGLRDLNIPFYGVYGACSTMAESLSLAAVFVDNDLAEHAVAVTSSHFCSAERQFRLPLEYGGQRAPTSQWTATAAGAAVISKKRTAPYVRAICIGKITDLGIKDINNMGAAMAPAAYHTIQTYLEDTHTTPDDYDLILTGDLGKVGSELLLDLMKRDGIDLSKHHNDCGKLIYDMERQDVHAGGSGAGCSASVLCSYIFNRMRQGILNEVLFIATGALMSTTSFQQGESIPAIAHLVHLTTHLPEVK